MPLSYNRRSLLKMGGMSALSVSIPLAANAATATDFANMRARWVTMLTGGNTFTPSQAPYAAMISQIQNAAQTAWTSMQTAAGRTYLWADLAGSDNNTTRRSIERLKTMALASAQAGSGLLNNATLKSDIVSALQWIATNRYNNSVPLAGNWWEWEIGIPQRLFDVMVLLHASISTTLRNDLLTAFDRFSSDPTKHVNYQYAATGANQLWVSWCHIARGVLGDSEVKLTGGRNAVPTEFNYVTSGDGFYSDGSFLQHGKHAYTGGYGKSMLTQTGDLLYLLQGSVWTFTQADWVNVRAWVYSAFEPLMYKGALMDMVRGREISRAAQTDHASGHAVMQGVIRLAELAPAADAVAFKSMVKYWISVDTARTFYQFDESLAANRLTLDLARLARSYETNTAIGLRGEQIGFLNFRNMDRVVHRRTDWAIGISMYSSRIFNYESINGENLRGFYTSNGMTYLYNADLAHYSDAFWTTVDPLRLPGTTVDNRPRAGDGSGQESLGQPWVGGAGFVGSGLAGMHLNYASGGMNARKSWLCFGDFILCMGADITSSTGYSVESIIENRNLGTSGTNVVTMNSTANPVLTTTGVTADLSAASWLHLASVGGYVMLGNSGAVIRGVRQTRTGSWRDVNTTSSSPTGSLTRRYVTLWIDHGVNPTGAKYAYVMLPNRTAAETSAYANAPNFTILENSSQAQAASGPYGLTGVNFWAGKTVGAITANAPCSVCVSVYNGAFQVAISDPTQTATASIVVTVQQANTGLVSSDTGLSVSRTASSATFTFSPTGKKGETVRAVLSV